MVSIEERALNYARMADCRDRREMELARLDYIAGAKEERILVCEQIESWLADMVCEGVLETNNLPRAIARFKADFGISHSEPKYYGDDDGRSEQPECESKYNQ